MIGYPNLTYLLIGQNFVNIMITELSERRIDLHPLTSVTRVHVGCQSIRQSDNSAFVNIIVIVYSFGRLGTFYFFSKSSDFEIFWTNVAILESTNPKKNSRTLDAF